MNAENINGIAAALTPPQDRPKRRVTREEANPILRGLTDSRVEADVDSRAIKSLSTGDPRGLEMLDFGSVRGKPAVAFKAPDGSRQVMMVSMPTYLASLKARTTGRQVMRQKIEEDMKRKALQNDMAPKFQTALEKVSVSQGPLFAPLMASLFESDPAQAAFLVNEVLKLERRDPGKAFALSQEAVKGETLRMAGAQRKTMQGSLTARLRTEKGNIASLPRADQIAQRQKVELMERHAGNLNKAMEMLITDTPMNYGQTLTERVKSNPQYAQMILDDVFKALQRGTVLPNGQTVELKEITDEVSGQAYIDTWQTALQQMGYTQPLTDMDKALLIRLGQRNPPSPEIAGVFVDKYIERSGQDSPASNMAFGVDESKPGEFDNFARKHATLAGLTEEDAVRLVQTAEGRERFRDLIESNREN